MPKPALLATFAAPPTSTLLSGWTAIACVVLSPLPTLTRAMPPVPNWAIVPFDAILATTIWRSVARAPPGVSPAARTEPSASDLMAWKLMPLNVRLNAGSSVPTPVAL